MVFANLKVGTRLGYGFGMVMLLLIGITGVGIMDLHALNQSTDLIVKDRYPKVAMANTVLEEVNVIAIAMGNTLVLTNEADIKEELNAIASARKNINENLGQLDRLLSTPKGKEILNAIRSARDKYRAGQDEFIRLVTDGKKPEATTLLLNTLMQTQQAYLKEVRNLVRLGGVLMDKSSDEATAQYNSGVILILSLAGVAILLAGGFAYWVTRSITHPLNEAVKIAQTVASGNLTSHIEVKTTDETGQLLQALKDMNDSLVKIIGEVRSGTDTIATASSQIASGNLDLSSRTEQQASSLEETASSMEELTSTVKQNADNARQANQLAVSASDVALKGGTVVSQVVDTMGSINESAKKIVDIIGVIDGIAFQTNILALNAAVEAARAGEQGRGFAVVATEVRNLAQRSAAAAKEIKTLIGDSVNKVEVGSKLVDEAGSTMQEIVDSVRRVTDIMGEITAASSEQSAGIEQVNQAIAQMDEVTQQNAALVEEAAAAASSLQDQAGNLAHVVSIFKLEGQQTAAAPIARGSSLAPKQVHAMPRDKKPRLVGLAANNNAPIKMVANGEWEEF
jgi:methyl-accepting chemotaxis protein